MCITTTMSRNGTSPEPRRPCAFSNHPLSSRVSSLLTSQNHLPAFELCINQIIEDRRCCLAPFTPHRLGSHPCLCVTEALSLPLLQGTSSCASSCSLPSTSDSVLTLYCDFCSEHIYTVLSPTCLQRTSR